MVGDRIVVTECRSRLFYPMVGLYGTIIAENVNSDGYDVISVMFDDNIGGHDCSSGGNPCEYGYGWNLCLQEGDKYEVVGEASQIEIDLASLNALF